MANRINKFQSGDFVLPKGWQRMSPRVTKHDAMIVRHTRLNSKGVRMVHVVNGMEFDSYPESKLVLIRSV